MTSLLLNPFFWFAVALSVWAFWRLASWAASGGRLPLRRRRGSAGAFGTAGLAGQQFYQPGAKQAVEMQRRDAIRREEDDEGEPPV